MGKIKIKRRRLFEDDILQQTTTQLPVLNQQPQLNQQQLQQPQLNQQQLQTTTQLPVLNQQPQLDQQQLQQQNQYALKVSQILTKMENTYWIMSVNLPEEIQKEIPDFKQGNQLADPIIKLWNDFKNKPEENTFNAFVDAFKNFGVPAQNTSTGQQQVNAGLKAAYSFNKKLMDNLNLAKQQQYYNSIVEDYFDKTEFTLY